MLSLTQQEDFNFPSLLLLLLLEDPFDLLVHSDVPLLLLGQAAHAGAVAPHPAARHGHERIHNTGMKRLIISCSAAIITDIKPVKWPNDCCMFISCCFFYFGLLEL